MRTRNLISRVLIAACSVATAMVSVPPLAVAAATGDVTMFPVPLSAAPAGITADLDGNFWFGSSCGDCGIFRIRAGAPNDVTHFSLPTTGAGYTLGITTSPDGNVWFTESASGKIGRINPTGTDAAIQASITEFPLPTAGYSSAGDITAGQDGNLWFTEQRDIYHGNAIGRMTPTGTVTEFAIPTAQDAPVRITQGPDGNLWFTELAMLGGSPTSQIGRINPTGTDAGIQASITEFPLPTEDGQPFGITKGPDGNVWFTEFNRYVNSHSIGRITPGGARTEFPVSTSSLGIATGLDGNLWFTEPFTGIGRITPTGIPSDFPVPSATTPGDITAGPGGTLWFTSGYGIGRVQVASSTLTVTPSVTSGLAPLSVTYSYTETNDGTVPLSGVIVADNPCSPVTFVSGAGGPRGTLQPGVTWTFTCSHTFTTAGVFPDAATATGLVPGSTVPVVETATATVNVLPLDALGANIAARVLTQFNGPVALFSVPVSRLPLSVTSVQVDWGDGGLSSGSISRYTPKVFGLAFPTQNLAYYEVLAGHTYQAVGSKALGVKISLSGFAPVDVTGTAEVAPLGPQVGFTINPPAPTANDIVLLVPQPQDPRLRDTVVDYLWLFPNVHDSAPVLDDAQHRPIYMQLLHRLAADPGNTSLQLKAQGLGIIPNGGNWIPGDATFLTTDQVRELVQVWLQYFPGHIVPHIFHLSSTSSVQGAPVGPEPVVLTETDRAGQLNIATVLASVTDKCLVLGGPLSFLFWGTTTCDAVAHFNAVWDGYETVALGPGRTPDYVTVDLPIGPPRGVAGGFDLTITHDHSVYVGFHLGVGQGISTGTGTTVAALQLGYVQRPHDSARQVPDTCPTTNCPSIDGFVNGFTVSIGYAAQLGPIGGGVNLVESPSVHLAGAEYTYPVTLGGRRVSLSGQVGGGCNVPWADLGSGVIGLLANWFDSLTILNLSAPPLAAVLSALKALPGVIHGVFDQCISPLRALIPIP
jgi:streptogramin lyase